MQNLFQKLMLGGSTAALLTAMSVAGARAQGGGEDIEQVVVSASRISIAGYQQPTPVSVVGAAALLEAANADIGDTLRQMPAMGNSPTPEKGTNGNASNSGALGVSGINLRQLGNNRNLVLFDGQRVVAPILTGGVDLSAIPSSLVQRVDVVTGGASAAWGSDAVSGVVNLIINKSFTGFKASLDGQDTGQDNRRSYGATATWGVDLLGGRAHFVGALTYNNSPSFVFMQSARWYNRPCVLANPAYVANPIPANYPQNLHYTNCGQNVPAGGAVLTGGLVTPVPATGTSGMGIGFGPNGVPYNFVIGNSKYYNNAGSLLTSSADAVGGTTNQSTSAAQIGLLTFPIQQGTGFAYASYKITPDIQAGLMLNYGYDRTHSSSLTINATGTIKSDNAYLDPTILALMNAASPKITSIAVTSNFTDGIDLSNPTYRDFNKTVGAPVAQSVRQVYRAVFTLDGALGSDWSWNAGIQHSESHLHEVDTHIEIQRNLAFAVDAVRVTTANRGTTGLTLGTIVCRATTADATVSASDRAIAVGCVPLNIMGTGVQSQAAVDYTQDNNDYYFLNIQQDTFGGSMQGTLPWDLLGAGVPAISFGAEYRKEAAVATAGFYGTNLLLGGGNFQPVRGQFNVEEGFVEVDLPLIKNGIVQELSASMAGRYTSYSLSGAVETWKLGLTSQVNDDIRLRTTWSYDIRAPNLGELFGAIPASGGQVDYKTSVNVPAALSNTYYNHNLQPEKSTTISGGVVLTPQFIPGLSLSADWYSINVKGIIAVPSSTQTLNFCKAGIQSYCNNYVYNPALVIAGSNPNGLAVVLLVPQNNGFLNTSGLDFQADYSMALFTGNLALHLAGNYNDQETESIFGSAAFDFAGSMSGDSQFSGVPKTKITLGATYSEGGWTVTVQNRFIGQAKLNNAWASGVQIDNNQIPLVNYIDLRGTYKWNENVSLYGSIDNFFDTPPPMTVGTNASTNGVSTTSGGTYDTLGRMFHAGIRFSY